MPFIPVSLVVHLAFTSAISVTWAVLTLRLFRIRYPAARALILAGSVLLPAGGFVAHLLVPHECDGQLGLLSHLACLGSSAMGNVGAVLLASSLAVAASQAIVTWGAHRRAARQSIPVDAVDWQDDAFRERLCTAADRIARKGSGRPRIMVTSRPGVCCTVGILRPVILISEGLCRSLDLAELEAVLAHEMAHIARHDNGIGLASVLVRALTFFSPAAYVAIRLYMSERENAADDLATRITGDRLALASAIVKVAKLARAAKSPEWAPASAYGASGYASASDGAITARVQRLMDDAGESGQGMLPRILVSVAGLVAIIVYFC